MTQQLQEEVSDLIRQKREYQMEKENLERERHRVTNEYQRYYFPITLPPPSEIFAKK